MKREVILLFLFTFIIATVVVVRVESSTVYHKGHLRFFDDDGTFDYFEGTLVRKDATADARDCVKCRNCCCGWKDPRKSECEDCRKCQSDYIFDCSKKDNCEQTQISLESINQTCIQTCPSVNVNCGNNVSVVQDVSQNCTQESRQMVANVSCEQTCNVEGMTCMTSCPGQCTTCTSPANCILCINACFNVCAQTFDACITQNCPVTNGALHSSSSSPFKNPIRKIKS